ncbi:AGE family epimerase/isomerase [Planctomyces sp. SH-PL62]|uniref:AGE family epimerase/isomerase n=1 Tax=Planctomyces sp. SH-PL62 TaxID=1636152 RepID=UPI00078CDA34|nr:AGE family epimerase/isomerase [Planctomyces sp. SH-PL62]AMV37198.1 Cellobiose 2-epimerase [Planctomyces sp. SH-PL62]
MRSQPRTRGLAIVVAAWVLTVAPLAAGADEPAAPTAARLRELLAAETGRWLPAAVDRDAGGFHQEIARDWTIRPDQSKFLVYQARMTWTAAAYAEFEPARRDEHLAYARHGLAFLDTVMRDAEQGGFHWILDAKGRLDPALGDEKHVYGTSFVVYAAAKLRAVSGDDLALKVARDAFDWLEAHAHDPRDGGWFEAVRRDGTAITGFDPKAPVAGRKDRLGVYYGYKTMNSHIHLLEALAELAKVDDRPIVRERLREAFHIVRDKIAVEPGALNLYLTRDWRAVPAHDSFGHDVETAYLLVEAAEVLHMPDDEATWKVARGLVDHALDWGWDDRFGGFYDKGDVFAAGAYDFTKVWWTQAEGLNALAMLDRKYGRETDRYARAFAQQWGFIERSLLDPEFGGWFAEAERDGRLRGDGAKASPWKADYHTARAMMNVARLLTPAPASAPTSETP